MPKESNLEFKVGLFVVLALIGFTIFIFSISDTSVFERGKSIKIIFGFANGLKKSAPVRIAGVDEGIVKDINLFFDREDSKTKAEVELWVKKSTKIPIDSVIMINQLGLLGEKYIEIIPGLDRKQFFEDGQTFIGNDPVAQEEISEKVMEIASQLERTISSVNKVIDDEKNITSLQKTIQNLSSMTTGLDNIISDIREGKGTVGRLLYDQRLYNDLQEFTADLKQNPWKLLYKPKNK